MKQLAHWLALAIGGLVSILQIPSVHNLVVSFIAHNPDLSAIVAGLAAIGALYFNPKAS